MVLERTGSDLGRVIASKTVLTDRHVKAFVYQILLGVHRLHCAGILHRDLKPGNLLVNEDCVVKVADLGLARAVGSKAGEAADADNSKGAALTEYVVTRWYRAPELLLNTGAGYGTGVDIWSIGCIFAELLNRVPLFPGGNYVAQLRMILNAVGGGIGDVAESMLGGESFFNKVKEGFYRDDADGGCVALREVIMNQHKDQSSPISEDAMDLLTGLLKFVPAQRLTTLQALNHRFFKGTRKRKDIERAGDVNVYGDWESDATGTGGDGVKTELWGLCNRAPAWADAATGGAVAETAANADADK
jgi:serine/threonine protein kinase